MTRLEQTEVCGDCGRPYLVFQGHDCTGPRTSPGNETARRGI